jgi:hypothetical protein
VLLVDTAELIFPWMLDQAVPTMKYLMIHSSRNYLVSGSQSGVCWLAKGIIGRD